MTFAPTLRRPGWRPLAGLMAGAGVLHFVMPGPYRTMVPRALGDPGPWVMWSGVAEVVCAAGLAHPRTRRAAGLVTAALFLAVYPANVQMSLTALRSERASTGWRAATLARLPLQASLVDWALRVTQESGGGRDR